MKRFTRILAGLALVTLAGAVAVHGREGWPWFLGAGTVFLAWGSKT